MIPVLVYTDTLFSAHSVFVDEVTPGGQADKTGKIFKGDKLTSCSAVLLKEGKEVSKEG